jgi:hypothetical protein
LVIPAIPEDQRKAPAEPRGRRRENGDGARRFAYGARERREAGDDGEDGARRREHVAGHDHERHLHRERDELPEASPPGVDDLERPRMRQRDAQPEDDDGRNEREHERVGEPLLGSRRQHEREAPDEAVAARVRP